MKLKNKKIWEKAKNRKILKTKTRSQFQINETEIGKQTKIV
jgi:hypothetical protein